MPYVEINNCEILDKFHNGKWILLNIGVKIDKIDLSKLIVVDGRFAKVEKIVFGQREKRVALSINYSI